MDAERVLRHALDTAATGQTHTAARVSDLESVLSALSAERERTTRAIAACDAEIARIRTEQAMLGPLHEAAEVTAWDHIRRVLLGGGA